MHCIYNVFIFKQNGECEYLRVIPEPDPQNFHQMHGMVFLTTIMTNLEETRYCSTDWLCGSGISLAKWFTVKTCLVILIISMID